VYLAELSNKSSVLNSLVSHTKLKEIKVVPELN